jgi:hypothetical protein
LQAACTHVHDFSDVAEWYSGSTSSSSSSTFSTANLSTSFVSCVQAVIACAQQLCRAVGEILSQSTQLVQHSSDSREGTYKRRKHNTTTTTVAAAASSPNAYGFSNITQCIFSKQIKLSCVFCTFTESYDSIQRMDVSSALASLLLHVFKVLSATCSKPRIELHYT